MIPFYRISRRVFFITLAIIGLFGYRSLPLVRINDPLPFNIIGYVIMGTMLLSSVIAMGFIGFNRKMAWFHMIAGVCYLMLLFFSVSVPEALPITDIIAIDVARFLWPILLIVDFEIMFHADPAFFLSAVRPFMRRTGR